MHEAAKPWLDLAYQDLLAAKALYEKESITLSASTRNNALKSLSKVCSSLWVIHHPACIPCRSF